MIDKKSFKNVKRVTGNEIIMDFDHPELGWIPYTAINGTNDPLMQEIWESVQSMNLDFDEEILVSRGFSDVMDTLDLEIFNLAGKYTKSERDLWDVKRAEAEKVLSGEGSELIEIEAEVEGEKPESLAKKIVEKSDQFRRASILNEARKRKVSKDFAAIKTVAEMKKIVKSYEWLNKEQSK